MNNTLANLRVKYDDPAWIRDHLEQTEQAITEAITADHLNDEGLEALLLLFPRILMIDPVRSGQLMYQALVAYKSASDVSNQYLSVDFQNMEVMFQRVQRQSYKQYDNRLLLKAYIALFQVLMHRLDAPADLFIDSANRLANLIGDTSTKAELKLAIALLYSRYATQDYAQKSIDLAMSTYGIFVAQKKDRYIAQSAWAIGVGYRVLGENNQALHWLSIAEKFVPVREPQAIATTYVQQGSVYFQMGREYDREGQSTLAQLNYHRARMFYMKALDLIRKETQSDIYFGTLESLALALAAIGRFDESQEHYQRILNRRQTKSVVHTIRTINNYIWSIGTQLQKDLSLDDDARQEKKDVVQRLAEMAEGVIANFHNAELTDMKDVRHNSKWIADNL